MGSSPLTRGKRGVADHGWYLLRLIPAHAGKTAPYSGLPAWSAAHPRSRGENLCVEARGEILAGSSPLTRGKRPQRSCGLLATRLIPAHAGKTAPYGPATSRASAHPRSRGENSAKIPTDDVGMGSSPLTRGKLRRWPPTPKPHRLIPAHAGKTGASMRLRLRRGAHPRSRGENKASSSPLQSLSGSSPLTRGKPVRGGARQPQPRLIPAHAGKTPRAESRVPGTRAHPRSRGENWTSGGGVPTGVGSSPLTRGKR